MFQQFEKLFNSIHGWQQKRQTSIFIKSLTIKSNPSRLLDDNVIIWDIVWKYCGFLRNVRSLNSQLLAV